MATLQETKGKQTKGLRKYWEDFEDEDKPEENPEDNQQLTTGRKTKTPNENFWKAALTSLGAKLEEEEPSLFKRREDLDGGVYKVLLGRLRST